MGTTTTKLLVAAVCSLAAGATGTFGQSNGRVAQEVQRATAGEARATVAQPGATVTRASAGVAQAGAGGKPDREQVEWCHTQIKWDEKQGETAGLVCTQGGCDDPDVRDANIPDPATPIKTINVRFHVFANNDGSNPAATQADVDNQLAQMNSDFAPYRVQFAATTVFHNDAQFRNFADAEEAAMKGIYAQSPSTQCNVYVVNIQAGYLGVGTFPWDSDALTVMGGIIVDDNAFGAGEKTMTHEMGHNIGLWHTHHGVSEVIVCGPCYELASGTNGDVAGDLCSDTDPTPTNFNCAPPGGSDVCSGFLPWGPTDPQNYMGYASDACYSEFSPQQSGRYHCWISAQLSGWLTGGAPGSCAGACGGQSPDGCFCDDECVGFGDCCPDVCQECPGVIGCGGADSDCCVPNGTPGCDTAGCEASICSIDPFCCDTEWDGLCADQAAAICLVCGGSSDCCAPAGQAGCEVPSCQDCVCAMDPFCCETEWDGICQGQAEVECADSCPCDTQPSGSPCGPGAGNCGEANGTPGCDDIECCETVCAQDPFCCETEWDDQCAGEAADLCSPCGDPAAGDCFIPNGTPGCDDAVCCEAICAVDPFCCDVQWDGLCADAALNSEFCNPAACPGSGDCCEPNGTIGCSDALCCETVCASDPFCCETEWDSLCADEAAELCGDTCHDCCTVGGPGCTDPDVEACVCAQDPFCCETGWDALCVDEVEQFGCGTCGPACGDGTCDPDEDCMTCKADCGPCPDVCGDPAGGDCCVPGGNGTPGCDDLACCESVCAADPFCCDTQWDGLCADEALVDPNCSCDACGNGTCDPDEDCATCEEDCDPCPDVCGDPASGDCCVPGGNGTPGCDDLACCESICATDPFCCDTEWDGLCADEAAKAGCCPGECPPAEPISIDPPPGTEDARQPHNPGPGQDEDPALRQGIGSTAEPIVIVLSASGAAPDCFALCETSPDAVLGPNAIASVTEDPPGTYTITLHHAIAPGAWTTIAYPGGTVAYLAQPANANADGFSNANDILSLIDVLNGAVDPVFGIYSTDIDHSGIANASDILRIIDLLNGATPYDVWNGQPRPENTCP